MCVYVCVRACVLIIIFKCINYSILVDAHFCNFEINCDTDQLWLVLKSTDNYIKPELRICHLILNKINTIHDD